LLIGEGKRLFGRLKHKCWDGFEMNVKEIRCEGVNWIRLAEDRIH
jgi:hypothetical protein